MSKTKMKYVKGVVMAIVLSMTLVACESKRKVMHDLQELRTEIKEHSAEYTEAEWKDAYNRYMELCQKCDEIELTREEQREINKVKGEIAGYAATTFTQKIIDEFCNLDEKIESFTKGFTETFQGPK